MSAEYETVKSSDYERKVFKADSEKKKHPALAVLFLLLTLIFVTLAFLILRHLLLLSDMRYRCSACFCLLRRAFASQ